MCEWRPARVDEGDPGHWMLIGDEFKDQFRFHHLHRFFIIKETFEEK